MFFDSSPDFLLLIIGLFIFIVGDFNRLLLFLEWIFLENILENLDYS